MLFANNVPFLIWQDQFQTKNLKFNVDHVLHKKDFGSDFACTTEQSE